MDNIISGQILFRHPVCATSLSAFISRHFTFW